MAGTHTVSTREKVDRFQPGRQSFLKVCYLSSIERIRGTPWNTPIIPWLIIILACPQCFGQTHFALVKSGEMAKSVCCFAHFQLAESQLSGL